MTRTEPLTARELLAKLQALPPADLDLPVARVDQVWGAVPVTEVRVADYTDDIDFRSRAVVLA